MSLKVFHILFIASSIAMSAFVGGWGLVDFQRTGDKTHLAVGVVTLVLGAALIWYSTWFVRKIRNLKVL